MNRQDPVAAFRLEAADLLEQIEQGLLDLGHQLTDRELIDAVFRGLHTLKGSGAMFGFDALADFTHHCETAFDRVRKGLAPATEELVAVILSAKDHMRALIDGTGSSLESEAILAQLQKAIDGGAASETSASAADGAVAEAEAEAGTAAKPAGAGWKLSFRLPAQAMANGTNPLTLLDELRELGPCSIVARTEAIPPLVELVPTECHIGWDVELSGSATREDIEDVFIFVMDDMELTIEPLIASPCETDSDTRNKRRIQPSCAPLGGPGKVEGASAASEVAGRPAPKAIESVRVPADRLDELMDRVGELVIAQSRLSQLANHGLAAGGELAAALDFRGNRAAGQRNARHDDGAADGASGQFVQSLPPPGSRPRTRDRQDHRAVDRRREHRDRQDRHRAACRSDGAPDPQRL